MEKLKRIYMLYNLMSKINRSILNLQNKEKTENVIATLTRLLIYFFKIS